MKKYLIFAFLFCTLYFPAFSAVQTARNQQKNAVLRSNKKASLDLSSYPPVPGQQRKQIPQTLKNPGGQTDAGKEKKAVRKSFTIQYITKNKIRYVHLENVADFYQLTMRFPKKKQIVLKSKNTTIEMYSDRREGKINGRVVYFLEPVLTLNNRMYITENDFLRIIDPALRTKRLKCMPVHTIMIDPGHGGSDSGAPGPVMQEKQVNLLIARKLAVILKKNGFRVLMTRSGDTFPTLQQRSDLCKKYKPDLYISIHSNATTNKTMNGIETYLLTPQGAASTNDTQVKQLSFEANAFDQNNFRLAWEIQKSLIDSTDAVDRGVRHARFFVLKNSTVPAVLVECGYLSCKTEGRKLADNRYQNKLAAAIAEGVFQYIKLTEVKKDNTSSKNTKK